MIDNLSGDEHLITDGLSRRLPEADILISALSFFKRPNPKVIYINVSRDWATNRLISRGRKDDSATGVTSRMDWFEESVVSVLDYFKKRDDYEFIEINGEQPIEGVHNEVLAKLGLNM
jgi:adenylate kinase family enzyme